MPGRKPRTRHAGSAPVAPPDAVGEGTGRRVRDVPHRRSRKGVGGMLGGFSTGKAGGSYRQGRAGRLFNEGGQDRWWNGWLCLSSHGGFRYFGKYNRLLSSMFCPCFFCRLLRQLTINKQSDPKGRSVDKRCSVISFYPAGFRDSCRENSAPIRRCDPTRVRPRAGHFRPRVRRVGRLVCSCGMYWVSPAGIFRS